MTKKKAKAETETMKSKQIEAKEKSQHEGGKHADEMKDLRAKIESLQKQVQGLQSRYSASASRLEAFDRQATEDHLNSIHDTAKAVSTRMKVELHKNMVVTEVIRLAMTMPNGQAIIKGVVATADECPVEWWAKGKEWALCDWIEFLEREGWKEVIDEYSDNDKGEAV
jgi:molecular chaperone GrpE (heat shock protein)